jgi:hypothetical protein
MRNVARKRIWKRVLRWKKGFIGKYVSFKMVELKENWGGLLEILEKDVSDPHDQPENIKRYIMLLKRLEEAKTLGQIKSCFSICENDANSIIQERNRDLGVAHELIQPIENKKSLGLTENDINYLNSPLLDEIYKVVNSACIPYDKLAQKGFKNALSFFLKRVPIDNHYTAMQNAIEYGNLHMVNVLLGQYNYQPIINGILFSVRSSTKIYNSDLMQKLANYYTLNEDSFLWACENNDMKYIQSIDKNLDREVFIRAFHTSISCDNFELLDYFLEKMVTPDEIPVWNSSEIRPQNRRAISSSKRRSMVFGLSFRQAVYKAFTLYMGVMPKGNSRFMVGISSFSQANRKASCTEP